MPRRRKLPPNVRRHRDGFRGVLQIDGRRRYGPVYATPDEASEWVLTVRRLRPERIEGATLGQAFDLLLDDVRSVNGAAMTLRAYRQGWATIRKHHFRSDTPCHRIRTEHVRAAVDREMARTSSAGAQKLLTHMRLILEAAKRGGHVTQNVAKDVRRPKHRQRQLPPFTFEQIHAIADRIRSLDVAPSAKADQVADWILVAAYTAARRSELARMRAEDADFSIGRVLIRGKTADRFVPLADEAVEPLRRVIAGGMFPSNPTSIGNRLGVYRDKLGIPRLTIHQLRRSFATRLAAQGVSPYVLRDLLGHANLQQTLTYYEGVESRAAEAVRLLRPEGPPRNRADQDRSPQDTPGDAGRDP